MLPPNRLLVILSLALLVGVVAAPPLAAQSNRPVRVYVNGDLVPQQVAPVIWRGRVMVPLRGVFEQLGALVQWLPLRKQIQITAPGKTVLLAVGNRTGVIDGRNVALDVAPFVLSGRTYVPLRFIGEALGATVDWRPQAREVHVARPPFPGTEPRALEPPLQDILARPGAYADRLVRIRGRYRGWDPPSGPATGSGRPVDRSDWGLVDDTGAIFVSGQAPNLDPQADLDRVVVVRGYVRVADNGVPYLQATEVLVPVDEAAHP